jgi:hypothetical protein
MSFSPTSSLLVCRPQRQPLPNLRGCTLAAPGCERYWYERLVENRWLAALIRLFEFQFCLAPRDSKYDMIESDLQT